MYLLLLAAALAGDPLVGIWTSTEGETITLGADGSAQYAGQPLQWTSQGTTLVLQGSQGSVSFGYAFSGADLVLDSSGQKMTFHAVAPPSGVVDPSYVGRWRAPTATWILAADGSGRVGKEQFTWSIEPGFMVLVQNGQIGRVPFRREGNRIITTVQGREDTLVLLEGAAGTWYGNESSIDPTIVMSYSQYITLYPDHSVGWSKSELTGSRSSPVDGWERFSSGHESGGAAGSYGTWSESGGRLTIQFNSGKTMSGNLAPNGESVVLQGAGVLEEGAAVRFERQ